MAPRDVSTVILSCKTVVVCIRESLKPGVGLVEVAKENFVLVTSKEPGEIPIITLDDLIKEGSLRPIIGK